MQDRFEAGSEYGVLPERLTPLLIETVLDEEPVALAGLVEAGERPPRFCEGGLTGVVSVGDFEDFVPRATRDTDAVVDDDGGVVLERVERLVEGVVGGEHVPWRAFQARVALETRFRIEVLGGDLQDTALDARFAGDVLGGDLDGPASTDPPLAVDGLGGDLDGDTISAKGAVRLVILALMFETRLAFARPGEAVVVFTAASTAACFERRLGPRLVAVRFGAVRLSAGLAMVMG